MHRPCSEKSPLRRYLRLAGELGFEPRLTESESAVLPLNYSPLSVEEPGIYQNPQGLSTDSIGPPFHFRKKERALNAPSLALMPSDRCGSHNPDCDNGHRCVS